jgi:hypothetical protein
MADPTPTPPADPPAPAPTNPTPTNPPPPASPPPAPPAPDGTKAALQAENDQLRARLQREAVKGAAIPHGLVDPTLINYLPIEGTSIDASGNVVGVEAAVTKLRADHPAIFGGKPASAPAPAQNPPAATASVPQVTAAPTSIGAVPPAPPSPTSPPAPHAITRAEWRENKSKLIADAKRRLA